MCNEAVHGEPFALYYIPEHLKTQVCEEAERIRPYSWEFLPVHLKTQEMCNEAVRKECYTLWHVSDHLKNKEMCDKAIEDPGLLWPVPDRYKTQEMCDKAVEEDLCLLKYVPDWFVKQEYIDLWDDDDDYYDDDTLTKWYDGYQKRKAQKVKIKEELLPTDWHPNRVIDWCMSEDEKSL